MGAACGTGARLSEQGAAGFEVALRDSIGGAEGLGEDGRSQQQEKQSFHWRSLKKRLKQRSAGNIQRRGADGDVAC